jgi:hypothetical protein
MVFSKLKVSSITLSYKPSIGLLILFVVTGAISLTSVRSVLASGWTDANLNISTNTVVISEPDFVVQSLGSNRDCNVSYFPLNVKTVAGLDQGGTYLPDGFLPRCSKTSPVGLVSENGDIWLSGSLKSGVISPFGSQVGVLPLASNKILSFFSLPWGVGVSTRPMSDLNLSNMTKEELDNYSSRYTFATPATTLKSTDGSIFNFDYNKLAFSRSEQWTVVESAGGNISTVDWSNSQISTIAQTRSEHDNNVFAISNDGKQVFVAHDDLYNSYIYDTTNCTVAVGQSTRTCSRVKVGDKLSSKLPAQNNNRIVSARFEDNGDIRVYVRSTDSTQHYVNYMYRLSTSLINEQISPTYLGLGDSFSSGEGAYNYIEGTDIAKGATLSLGSTTYNRENLCHTSLNSYPKLLAGNTQIFSVACSGAETKDIIGDLINRRKPQKVGATQIPDLGIFTPGLDFQARILEKYKPKKITLSIGGNDIAFSDKIMDCLLPGDCYSTATERLFVYKESIALLEDLTNLYKELKTASPDTVINVVGYPNIVSTEQRSCADNVRLSYNERLFAKDIVNILNGVIETATKRAGVNYIDITNALGGHELCSSAPSYEVAVNGITAGGDIALILGNESFHPNQTGQYLMYNAIKNKYTSNNSNPVPDNSTSLPPVPNSFVNPELVSNNTVSIVSTLGAGSENNLTLKYNDLFARTIFLNEPLDLYKLKAQSDQPNQPILPPNTEVKLYLFSDPTLLGTMTTDSYGNIDTSTQITIPSTIIPGLHRLILSYKNPLDSKYTVAYYDYIYVLASQTDIDGDGIPKIIDKCSFIQPANMDIDQDGTDDGCDGFVGRVPAVIIPETHPTPAGPVVPAVTTIALQTTNAGLLSKQVLGIQTTVQNSNTSKQDLSVTGNNVVYATVFACIIIWNTLLCSKI